jgi:hypothetical protein
MNDWVGEELKMNEAIVTISKIKYDKLTMLNHRNFLLEKENYLLQLKINKLEKLLNEKVK